MRVRALVGDISAFNLRQRPRAQSIYIPGTQRDKIAAFSNQAPPPSPGYCTATMNSSASAVSARHLFFFFLTRKKGRVMLPRSAINRDRFWESCVWHGTVSRGRSSAVCFTKHLPIRPRPFTDRRPAHSCGHPHGPLSLFNLPLWE